MNGIKVLALVILIAYFLVIGRLLFFNDGALNRQIHYQERVVNLVPLVKHLL